MTTSRIKLALAALIKEVEFSYARSSGPGGQNVNKTNTKVHLKWHVLGSSLPSEVKMRFIDSFRTKMDSEGYVVISSQTARDQDQNRGDCLEKLETMITAVWTPPKKRRPTKPTKGSKERRLTAKSQRAEVKKGRQKGKAWD